MKTTRALLPSLLLLLVVGCKSRQDMASRVVGTWAVDHQDRGDASGAGYGGELVLQGDSRFTARGLPSDLFDDSDMDGGRAITGTGTWTLRNEGDADRVGLRFEQVQNVDLSHMPQTAELQVDTGRDLALFFDPGDPDEDERVTLHKQSLLDRFRK